MGGAVLGYLRFPEDLRDEASRSRDIQVGRKSIATGFQYKIT